jgi:hypothetical protein
MKTLYANPQRIEGSLFTRPVPAASIDGIVREATLTQVPAKSGMPARGRLEFRLEGKSQVFVIPNACYRLDAGERVVVYTEPFPKWNPNWDYPLEAEIKRGAMKKTIEKNYIKLNTLDYIENKPYKKRLLKINKDPLEIIGEKFGLKDTDISSSFNKFITTNVVGIQVLDENGNVKFQAVHAAGYHFGEKL